MTHWSPADREAYLLKTRMETPVAEMKLSVRMINTLEEYDVIMASDLITKTYEDLMGMKNFGETSLREVKAAVKALGLPVPNWRPAPKPKKPAKSVAQGWNLH
jgi:DNA-directed RNA polymerase subunit alpha